mmetsp:Transcript_33950/g.55017  ORF Transcript_33950/g.55017 Transcript_33950/m.55017 type:complete len:496 (-) Transcript_33950:71-1558(-)
MGGPGEPPVKKARKQVDAPLGPLYPTTIVDHPTACYNIWYHKTPGERNYVRKEDRKNPPTRCKPILDCGWTKGTDRPGAFICSHFAKGRCAQGSDCLFLHRIPTPADDARLDAMRDIFGRDRHATDRDDMGGIGSFNRDNRTLYIGGIRRGTVEVMEKSVIKHFSEWGAINTVRILQDKCVAFVQYKMRASAEFAKEAMEDQRLDYDEILNVRWATEDPNPRAIKRKQDDNMMTAAEAVAKRHLEALQAEDSLFYPEAEGALASSEFQDWYQNHQTSQQQEQQQQQQQQQQQAPPPAWPGYYPPPVGLDGQPLAPAHMGYYPPYPYPYPYPPPPSLFLFPPAPPPGVHPPPPPSLPPGSQPASYPPPMHPYYAPPPPPAWSYSAPYANADASAPTTSPTDPAHAPSGPGHSNGVATNTQSTAIQPDVPVPVPSEEASEEEQQLFSGMGQYPPGPATLSASKAKEAHPLSDWNPPLPKGVVPKIEQEEAKEKETQA